LVWPCSKLFSDDPQNIPIPVHVGQIIGQLKGAELKMQKIKTNGERNNVRSIFLMLKPKYVEDLTVELSGKKNCQNYQRKGSVTTKYCQPSLSCTTHNQQHAAQKTSPP
jgi:hypothetical protein